MKRSGGVTAAAVVLLVGSAVLALIALITVPAVLLVAHRAIPGQPNPADAAIAGVFLYGALAAWGISTAVGIIRLRPWGRISILVMSALALLGTLLGLVAALVLLPQMNLPQSGAGLAAVRTVLILVFGLPGAIAAWWLVLFTRRSVALQFVPAGPEAPPDAALAAPLSSRGRRPVSITVIAIMFLIGTLSIIFPLVSYRSAFPAFLLGALLTGSKATFFYVALVAIDLAVGLGLWFMKPWARIGAIAVCIFSIANMIAIALRPGVFQQLMTAASESNQLAAPIEVPPALLWIIASFTTVLSLVVLWFLVASKPAFAGPNVGPDGAPLPVPHA